MAGALVVVPVFGYYVGYTWVDWALLVVLYFASGLGITVGYHRLVAHRSFECRPWVKVALLIAGGWALENSACKWAADHVRHHVRCDEEEDPYNATRGLWHHHAHQRDYRNGPRWYNFDPSKWFIFGLSLTGLAWNLCRIEPERIRYQA